MPLNAQLTRQRFEIVTRGLALRSGVLTKQSTVTFSFGPGKLSPDLARQLFRDAATYGGKLGMRIGRRQSIKSFEVAGTKVKASAALSREFHAAFGASPQEKWVAFPIVGQRSMLAGSFPTVLKITFRSPTPSAFQLVPMVTAFGNQDLAKHYVLGVTVLKARKPTVDSAMVMVS